MKAPVLGHAPAGSPTVQLADFLADVGERPLSADVVELGENILIDSIASALAGRHGDETAQVEAAARALGTGDATAIATEPLSLVGAALLNGYQITAVTLCDMHVAALNHVTPGVVATALALAEDRAVAGASLLRAVVVGLETSVRLGLGINFSSMRERGWHSPGVIGPFGAAAAAASLLDLDRAHTINALGIAGSQSAGTYAAWGTPTVKFHQTRGGVSGLLAGLLAREGFLSSQDILSHPDGGLLTTYSDGGNPDALLDGLGSDWKFAQVNLRRWPAATQFQSIIEATLDLVDRHAPDFDRIESVRISLPEDVYDAFGGFGWEDRFRARLSPRYVAAVVLADRRCWLDQFTSERLSDSRLTDFARDRVSVAADPTIGGVGARIEVEVGGELLHAECPVPKGDGTRPLNRSEIIAKFHDARAGALSDGAADEILSGLTDTNNVDDVRPLIRLLGRRSS